MRCLLIAKSKAATLITIVAPVLSRLRRRVFATETPTHLVVLEIRTQGRRLVCAHSPLTHGAITVAVNGAAMRVLVISRPRLGVQPVQALPIHAQPLEARGIHAIVFAGGYRERTYEVYSPTLSFQSDRHVKRKCCKVLGISAVGVSKKLGRLSTVGRRLKKAAEFVPAAFLCQVVFVCK